MEDGKTIAIVSYITWVGTIIAFILNNDKRIPFASFHIRQNIGLALLSLVNTFLIAPFSQNFVTAIIGVGIFVLWLIGLIGAVRDEEKLVPLFGDLFQDWFRNYA